MQSPVCVRARVVTGVRGGFLSVRPKGSTAPTSLHRVAKVTGRPGNMAVPIISSSQLYQIATLDKAFHTGKSSINQNLPISSFWPHNGSGKALVCSKISGALAFQKSGPIQKAPVWNPCQPVSPITICCYYMRGQNFSSGQAVLAGGQRVAPNITCLGATLGIDGQLAMG